MRWIRGNMLHCQGDRSIGVVVVHDRKREEESKNRGEKGGSGSQMQFIKHGEKARRFTRTEAARARLSRRSARVNEERWGGGVQVSPSPLLEPGMQVRRRTGPSRSPSHRLIERKKPKLVGSEADRQSDRGTNGFRWIKAWGIEDLGKMRGRRIGHGISPSTTQSYFTRFFHPCVVYDLNTSRRAHRENKKNWESRS